MTREEAIRIIEAKADYYESDKLFRAAIETIVPELAESEPEIAHYEWTYTIPFGAKDSELKEWEYTIPEGYEAIIEHRKVRLKKKESGSSEKPNNHKGLDAAAEEYDNSVDVVKPLKDMTFKDRILFEIGHILDWLATATGDYAEGRRAELRSMRKFIENLNYWKPSEEQMEALNVLNCYGGLSYIGQQNQLISLYNDLKKLM